MPGISKTFAFDAAHRLPEHSGKCKNLHGHRYEVTVALTATTLNEQGMVKDYGDLAWIKKRLDENLDHAYIYSDNDQFGDLVKKEGLKGYPLGNMQSTAENIAKHLFEVFKEKEPMLEKIIVSETPATTAYYP